MQVVWMALFVASLALIGGGDFMSIVVGIGVVAIIVPIAWRGFKSSTPKLIDPTNPLPELLRPDRALC